MKKSKIIILCLIFLMSFSCIIDSSSLGNGYFLLDKHESIDIGYPYGSTVYWSPTGYGNFSNIIVDSDVENCWHDNVYIIVEQKLNSDLLKARIVDKITGAFKYRDVDSIDLDYMKISKQEFSSEFKFPRRGKTNKELAKFIVDSLVENNSYFLNRTKNELNYYIINKNKKTVSEPLPYSEMHLYVKKNNIKFKRF